MHEIIVAVAFVFFVACPALVAMLPQKDLEEDSRPSPLGNLSAAAPNHSR